MQMWHSPLTFALIFGSAKHQNSRAKCWQTIYLCVHFEECISISIKSFLTCRVLVNEKDIVSILAVGSQMRLSGPCSLWQTWCYTVSLVPHARGQATSPIQGHTVRLILWQKPLIKRSSAYNEMTQFPQKTTTSSRVNQRLIQYFDATCKSHRNFHVDVTTH